ncbi:UDP-glucose 4-epimerase GalE [Mycoplasma sp. P36-A1]|uniref:UDP-glucose 4-epimerase GalE n=1 Tax=Mycoplasma sp. P36-A1 TaxID=3252900 RepID=UPI003C2DF7E7
MLVCVTGGAGYIGSHQVRMLLDNNYEVLVIDNLSTGHYDAIDKRALIELCDLRDRDRLKEIFSNYDIDAVMHFAAVSIVSESINNPLYYFDNNVYGLQVLLEIMNEHYVEYIVLSSTAATYGVHEIMPITEEYETNPINAYGETKLAMEKILKWVEQAYGINYMVLRYFNVAGASLDSKLGERHNPETHLIPIIMQVVNGSREYLSVYGNDYDTQDGSCIRDYIHVLDLCDAHILALESLIKTKKSNFYNLGYNHGYSVLEIIKATESVIGRKLPYKIESRRSGDPAELIASNVKIVEDLNWIPKYDDINIIIETAYNYECKGVK